MYDLTATEGATILSVLAREREPPTADVNHLGIPASTFYATRRRVYDAGWLTDRYVPHPWATGAEAVDCVLLRPAPSERIRVEREWAASPATVVLWSGPNVLFGVFFRQDGDAPAAEEGEVTSVTPDRGALPVYFDFSRPWSRFIRVETATGYPRGLIGPDAPKERARSATLSELVHQDPPGETLPSPGRRWHSPAGLTRTQRASLERGTIQSRTFLSVESLPPYEGRCLGETVFISGDLRPGVSSFDVLTALNHDCQISPFFLAADGTRVVLAALGQLGAGTSLRTKVPRAAASVVATLEAQLKGVRVTIERTDGIRKIVDHRYDRLFPPPRASPSPGDEPGP